jgi:hypothetical protein
MTAHRFGMASQMERWHWHGWEVLLTRDPSGPSIFAWPEHDGLLAKPEGGDARRLGGPGPRLIGG